MNHDRAVAHQSSHEADILQRADFDRHVGGAQLRETLALDVDLGAPGREHVDAVAARVQREARADEAGRAGDQQSHRWI